MTNTTLTPLQSLARNALAGPWLKTGLEIGGGLLVIAGLYLASLYNYLLFHTLAELFSIAVAAAIFMLVWNAWAFMDNGYLKFLGLAMLFIGGLDLVHTLAFAGMNIFVGYDANLPTQLWIAARYLQALTLLIAPFFLTRPAYRGAIFGAYLAICVALLTLIFTGIFPDCFIEGSGLTPFKIFSEYIISLILMGAMAWLHRQRAAFSPQVFRWLMITIVLTIGSELAFTFYISVYGFSNLVGHIFKILAFYYIYKAIIQTGLTKPYNLLFRELKQQEQLLRKARDAAETANQAKSVFLAGMSHELRSPLNVILGFAQLGLKNPDTPLEEKENLTAIYRSGEHLLALINNVLDMSKIEAGRSTLDEKSFNLTALLDEVEMMFRLKADEKQVQLVFSREPDVPTYIRADENKLRQVLINLLGNAIKFTEEGSVTLQVTMNDERGIMKDEIESHIHPSSFIKLHFKISDTGPGIPPAETGAIFVPFAQTQVGRVAREGTGLGLPISRKFVQLMGGDIAVKSVVGQGAVFAFDIPVELVGGDDADNRHPAELWNTTEVMALAPGQPACRILVVDDQGYNRRLMVKLLAPLGFELREAANGQDALEIWQAWQPHLIWMDMRMPVMDGHQATQQIKATARGQATTVIALTASVFEEERALVLSAGCDDFIKKPYREADIFNTLQKHLGVQYVYRAAEAAPTPEKTGAVPDRLTPEDLAGLPEAWLTELQHAAQRNDPDMAEAVINQISDDNPTTAAALATLIENYRFDKLQQLLEREKKERRT